MFIVLNQEKIYKLYFFMLIIKRGITVRENKEFLFALFLGAIFLFTIFSSFSFLPTISAAANITNITSPINGTNYTVGDTLTITCGADQSNGGHIRNVTVWYNATAFSQGTPGMGTLLVTNISNTTANQSVFTTTYTINATLPDSTDFAFWCEYWNLSNGYVYNTTANANITIDQNASTIAIYSVATDASTRYFNITNKTNTQLLALNISVTDATIGLADSAFCFIDMNGTNQSVSLSKTSSTQGWCNITGLNLTNHADAHRQIRIYVNDSLDNGRLNNSRYVTIDSNGPTVSIYSARTGDADPYVNATAKKNTALLTVNISVTDLFTGVGDTTYCVIDANGTNQTVSLSKTSSTQGWCNTTALSLANHADDNRQIRIYINDTFDNDRLNQSNYVRIDTSNPSPSASCSDIETGNSFGCSCSTSDGLSGVNTTSTSSTSPDGTGTPSSTGSFTYTCTSEDNAGNIASSTATYIVNQPPSSAGSSSGGGGGGSGTVSSSSSNVFTSITPNKVSVMKNFGEETGVKEIQIQVKNNAQNVKVTVSKYDGKPAEVSVERTGKTYQYMEINVENIDENLEKAIVTFKVEKTWTSENSVDKDNVVVSKFNEEAGEWNELTTIYSSEDDTYFYYDVELTSFSFFAISEKVMEEEEKTTGIGTLLGGEMVEKAKNMKWLWVIIVVVIVAVASGIALRMKKR